MIQSVDDLLKLLKTISADIDTKGMHLLCKDDALTKILYELIDKRYEPSIKYQASCLTHINLKLNKTIFMIKTQQ